MPVIFLRAAVIIVNKTDGSSALRELTFYGERMFS